MRKSDDIKRSLGLHSKLLRDKMLMSLSISVTIIDIVKHALTISAVKIDVWNYQQNCHRETGFVDSRCDYRLRAVVSVDLLTDFSCFLYCAIAILAESSAVKNLKPQNDRENESGKVITK